MEYFNKWYAVMQWDAFDNEYVELVKRPQSLLGQRSFTIPN